MEQNVKVVITQKVHIVEGLQANILIGINIIISENMDILIS